MRCLLRGVWSHFAEARARISDAICTFIGISSLSLLTLALCCFPLPTNAASTTHPRAAQSSLYGWYRCALLQPRSLQRSVSPSRAARSARCLVLRRWIDVGILFGMVIIYRSIFFFTLKAKEAMNR